MGIHKKIRVITIKSQPKSGYNRHYGRTFKKHSFREHKAML